MNNNGDIVVNEVRATKDYSKFTNLHYNRNIEQNHLANLKEAIRRDNLSESIPILVTPLENGKYGIVEGQHHFLACKELGETINYLVMSKFKTEHLVTLNSHRKNWSYKEYAHFNSSLGGHDYSKLIQFIEKYKLNYEAALRLTSKKPCSDKAFQLGSYKYDNEERALKILEIRSTLLLLGFKKAKLSRCVLGLIMITKMPNFRCKHFIEKAQAFPTKLYTCTNQKEYAKMFIDLYNYRTNKIERIRYEE